MDEKANLVESLLEKATDYGKTSYELVKLKTLDKTSDLISSFIPHSVVFVMFASFMIFFNLGLAFWLGEIFGKIFFGFFVVAGFYIILSLVLHFWLHKGIKGMLYNYIVKQLLK